MGTHTLATLPRTTSALAADLVLIHKAAENETYACTASDFRTIVKEGLDLGLADIAGLGDLAALDVIDTSYVNSLGALAALDEVGIVNGCTNGYMNLWSSGTSGSNTPPDAFSVVGSGFIVREASIKPDFTTYSAKVVATANSVGIYGASTITTLTEGGPWSTAGFVYTTSGHARLKIWDITSEGTITQSVSSEHPGGAAWVQLWADGHTVQTSGRLIYSGLEVDSGYTAYMAGFGFYAQVRRAPRYNMGRVFSSGGVTGFHNTGTYLGFYRSDGWRVYLDTSGNFICRTNSGYYALRYYGTASGAYGEGDVFLGSTNVGSGSIWWDQSAGQFILDGIFKMAPGHDFWLAGGSGDYAEIRFYGTSDYTGAYSSLRCLYGPELDITPSVANSVDLTIGGDYAWRAIGIYAYDQIYLRSYYDSNNQAYIETDAGASTGQVNMFACNSTAGYVLRYMVQSGYIGLIPANAGVLNLGTDTFDWDVLYCSATDTTDDINFFDEHDDLADIMNIKPLVDERGEKILDKFGLPIIDDATLPRYVVSLAQDDREAKEEIRDGVTIIHPARRTGEPIMTHDGKLRSRNSQWYGLFLGGIRQLNSKVDSSFAAFEARIRTLEAAGTTKEVTP